MSDTHVIFNRSRVKKHRDRAAAQGEEYAFLLQEMATRLSERLSDITKSFPQVLDLGAHGGQFTTHLKAFTNIGTIVQTDISQAMMQKTQGLRIVADEEFLPFAPASFDLVVSVGSLHWVNDVPGTLIQIQRILKPGGLFLASLPGGATLKELRDSLERAEQAISGGVSPRVSPFIDVKDAGSLLQRAGFTEPVTDSETLTISYENPLKLLHDLRGMGETNALVASEKTLSKRTLFSKTMEYYQQNFAETGERVPATFEIITLTAWKSDGTR